MNNNTKHTKGPWMIQTSTENSNLYEVVDSPTESVVIAGPYIKPSLTEPKEQHVTAWADAHLIAASPSLLSACEAALSCPEIYGTTLACILTEAVRQAGGNVNPLGTDRLPTETMENYTERTA